MEFDSYQGGAQRTSSVREANACPSRVILDVITGEPQSNPAATLGPETPRALQTDVSMWQMAMPWLKKKPTRKFCQFQSLLGSFLNNKE